MQYTFAMRLYYQQFNNRLKWKEKFDMSPIRYLANKRSSISSFLNIDLDTDRRFVPYITVSD